MLRMAGKATNALLNWAVFCRVGIFVLSALLVACGGGGVGSETPSLAAATETVISACPQSPTLPNRTIFFSAGYRINGKNIVELGAVNRCKDVWHLQLMRFDTSANLPRLRTPYRHEMHAPFRSPDCVDDQITTVAPSETIDVAAVVKDEENGLLLSTDTFQYHWTVDPTVAHAYKLIKMDQTGSGAYEQVAGFAFVTDSVLMGSIKPAQISANFNGNLFHKNSDMGVADEWLQQPFSIDFRRFTAVQNDAVLVLTEPGSQNVIAQRGKQLWWQSSIVLARSDGDLSPLIHVSGHDFNTNGCFDETGHNRLLLPIGNEKQEVQALVFIEYSPEKDGFPMLSVGRYYRY